MLIKNENDLIFESYLFLREAFESVDDLHHLTKECIRYFLNNIKNRHGYEDPEQIFKMFIINAKNAKRMKSEKRFSGEPKSDFVVSFVSNNKGTQEDRTIIRTDLKRNFEAVALYAKQLINTTERRL